MKRGWNVGWYRSPSSCLGIICRLNLSPPNCLIDTRSKECLILNITKPVFASYFMLLQLYVLYHIDHMIFFLVSSLPKIEVMVCAFYFWRIFFLSEFWRKAGFFPRPPYGWCMLWSSLLLVLILTNVSIKIQ